MNSTCQPMIFQNLYSKLSPLEKFPDSPITIEYRVSRLKIPFLCIQYVIITAILICSKYYSYHYNLRCLSLFRVYIQKCHSYLVRWIIYDILYSIYLCNRLSLHDENILKDILRHYIPKLRYIIDEERIFRKLFHITIRSPITTKVAK